MIARMLLGNNLANSAPRRCDRVFHRVVRLGRVLYATGVNDGDGGDLRQVCRRTAPSKGGVAPEAACDMQQLSRKAKRLHLLLH